LKHSYAFVDFDDHEAANKAIREMNGKAFVNGEELVVEQSGSYFFIV
jgi:RNA recognition motif-containing protein